MEAIKQRKDGDPMIRFQCHCGTRLKTSDDRAGAHARCPGCGAILRIPDAESPPTADWPIPEAEPDPPPYVPPPFVPPPPPAPAPAISHPAPPTASAQPTMVVVNQADLGPRSSGLGIASLIIGILCLLVGWMPLLGCAEIPVAVVGLILGFVGLLATSDGRTKLGFSIAGVLACLAAIALPLLMTILAGAMTSAAGR